MHITERDFLSEYAGLRTAYDYRMNRKNDLKQREERQTSECCRVLCLCLMFLFTVGWIAQLSQPYRAYLVSHDFRLAIGG